MANNPVQIVLNTDNYIGRIEAPAVKNHKDFYAERDQEFVAHKKKLLTQLSDVRKSFNSKRGSPVEYVKVVLQSEAWAKSHRPIEKIFDPQKAPCVGGNGIGEMYFEIKLDSIAKIEAAINKAEETTTWGIDKTTGKKKPTPTAYKSEVGAIANIALHQTPDKRKFTIEQAVKWLDDPRTGGGYVVELFVTEKGLPVQDEERARLLRPYIRRFESGIKSLGLPIELIHTREKWNVVDLLIVRFTQKGTLEQHQVLVHYLDHQSIVKRIGLPPILDKSDNKFTQHPKDAAGFPDFNNQSSYATVGIIDTGVSEHEIFSPWIVGRSEFLDQDNQDVSHGTFIAGLTVAAWEINKHEVFNEDPCQIFDLGLHPTDQASYAGFYPKGFVDFLEQLDFEIIKAKRKGIRIFNMSLAVESVVSDDSYGYFAAFIDELSVKHDVVFVISAGNLSGPQVYKPWPDNPLDVLAMLAEYAYPGRDRIFQPAESVHSITVGALNPPDQDDVLIPAQYSRRGPGCALGKKPDVVHVGGRYSADSGLYSVAGDGTVVSGSGTSYSAPLVAKILANVNHKIQGDIPREALRALLIHYCQVPHALRDKSLKGIARQFIGHGLPANSNEILVCDDHEITLMFNGILSRRTELDFDFSWPASLVGNDGKCKGNVRMTLVYTPLLDENFGAEYVRVNLDAYLRQQETDNDGVISFKGRLDSETDDKAMEKERIANGAKWWPIKQYSGNFSHGKGSSSNWKLVVDSLTRASQPFPGEGIPFSVIVTIADIKKKKPVFNEMRRSLQSKGVVIRDIKTALKVRP
ncbi:MAG: S8 family peptidase [Pseudomonadota bacterium]